MTGSGAVLTFVPARGRALSPKAETKPVHVTFDIASPHKISPDDVIGGSINYIFITYSAYAP